MRRSHWLALAVAAGLVIAVLGGLLDAPRESQPQSPEQGPDLYMEGADISQFDEHGALRYRLRAARVANYPARHVTELDAPRLTLFEQQPSPWTVSAKEGFIHHEVGAESGSGEIVELIDDVKLERRVREGEFIEVTTSKLTLYPQRKYAETDEAVMIQSHTGRTTAHGLRADLKAGQLSLYSGVHTVVLPQTL